MTQEDKELLVNDLCARLPYGVILCVNNGLIFQLISVNLLTYRVNVIVYQVDVVDYGNSTYNIEQIKPHLRPMSSMTEEEIKEYDKLFTIHSQGETYCENWEWIDFMNSHHFDYRGLIEKGLALPAPEGMYK